MKKNLDKCQEALNKNYAFYINNKKKVYLTYTEYKEKIKKK